MPVLHGAITFARFQVQPNQDSNQDPKRALSRGLKAKAFEPLDRSRGADNARSAGFVEVENQDATEFSAGDLYSGHYALFAYRVDQLKISASALKGELNAWAIAFEAEEGRKPARKEKTQQRDVLRDKLRAAAVPATRVYDVSWELKTGRLFIWASSRKAIEEVQAVVEEAFGVKLLFLTPVAIAARDGLDEASLAPTPALVGGGMEEEEVLRGAA